MSAADIQVRHNFGRIAMGLKKYFFVFLAALSFAVSGCHFVSSFLEEEDENISLSFDKSKTSVSMGAMDVINLAASKNQNKAEIRWDYDDSVIFAKTDNYSAVITGLAAGSTTLTASCGSSSASCVVTVSEDSYAVKVTNPYVYVSSDYVTVAPNETVRISAALFGGTVADIDGFSWSIDKPSVASISTEGNYCWITGLNGGMAKITAKHQKAAYGYSVLVNCSADGSSTSYITTTENIITINLSEDNTASFAVDLVNPSVSEYASGFEYSVVDSLGNEISSRPVVVSGAGGLDVSLVAYEVGECYVRCSHPGAMYDLDVLVRVIQNAETAYIEPSQTLVEVSDSGYKTVELSLVNYSGAVEPALYEWNFSENAEEYIDYTVYNGSSENTGDRIGIKGLKTGSVKITVSYPGVPSRNIIVLVRNIASEAADAAAYITTSQNYIRMTVDDEPVQINVTLKNAENSDIGNLLWKITNTADDASSSKVVNYKTGNGTSSSVSSRSLVSSSQSAYCVIEPVAPGTAYIDVSHPKALYPTRITVVVTEKTAAAPEKTFLNLASPAVMSIRNGESLSAKVSVSPAGNADGIAWESDGAVSVAGNGAECVVTAPASGSGGSRSTVRASHPDCDTQVVFTVVCYDTQADYEQFAVKSIYSYSTSATIQTGARNVFYLETSGFDEAPSITWKVVEGEGCIDFYTENGNKSAVVVGKTSGKAVLRASCDGCDDVSFIVNVVDAGIIDEAKTCYLSTSTNVLYFDDINTSQEISVDFFNIDSSSYPATQWSVSSPDFEISANGGSATVTSLVSGSAATLTVSHPLSENTLVVYLKCGRQYEYISEDSCYISASKDVFELYAGQDEVSLVASLNHTEKPDSSSVAKGFLFESEDSGIASVSYAAYSNTCYIKPLKNGATKIRISHPEADFEKEVVVIVKHAPDSLSVPYITTSANVITAVQGNYVTATVQLMNSTTISASSWHWTTSDSKISDVIANNGTSALLSANSPGTVEIKVSHDECPYSLKIIVVVLDAAVVETRPYISTSANIITLQKGSSTTLTAQMVGGNSDSDSNYFRFSASNSSMVLVNAVSGAAYVKALNTGVTYITVYNTRYNTSYSKTVLVVVEDSQEDGVYIKASQNILKLKPDDASQSVISAELVGGEATDGADFIWWADDYNIVGITAVAQQCAVVPTGRSGTTKIHVKHAKASRQVDVLVMVSSYDEFAFSSKSASITTEKLYFYPLQVPSTEEKYEIRYSSTNEDVCIVSGSNSVAWVCGTGYGNASLTASMVAGDGTVIASAEMLVSVAVVDPVLPVVSLGNSILTVEAGTSRVISAAISGENIDSTEKYNLKWSVKNKDAGLTLLDESADKTAYGSDCYVTFNYGGEYVLVCEHESTGASAELYIVVEEKGAVTIELSSNLETVYKDDGSFTLTATLTNASDSDYQNIVWSSVKVGGLSIVSVSKSKGAKCTVTPKNVGQTTVIAKLPDGKTARCVVIVKASAEITLELGTVHVIPGYTEVVNYRTNPENATINWYALMTTSSSAPAGSTANYFSYEDDTAKRQLRITGLLDYEGGAAGTITATMAGASSANLPTLKVYVNYDVELRLEDANGRNLTLLKNTCPDTDNVQTFNVVYYPADLDIDIKSGSGILACIPSDGNVALHTENEAASSKVSVGDVTRTLFTEEGIEKCRMTVSLVPHAETAMDITVSATLPGDRNGINTESRSFYYSAYYDSYDIEVVDLTASGAFTKFRKDSKGNVDSLTLGDGEEAVFYFKIKNENASGEIKSAEYTQTGSYKSPDYEKDDYWKTHSGDDRETKAFYIFGSNKSSQKLYELYNATPKKGLINFSWDADSSSKQTVYHISHNWDYYKDLPDEVTGSEWENYKAQHNYGNDFFDNLEVDYWLVSRELVYNGCYALPHSPAVPVLDVRWEKDVSHSKKGRFLHYDHYFKGWSQLLFNNNEVFYYKNGGHSGNADITDNVEDFYETCIPYVITTAELKANPALVRPDSYSPVGYQHTKGWFKCSDNFGEMASDKVYLQKLISSYITPTVRKVSGGDSSDRELVNGQGTISIKYVQGNGVESSKNITVKIEKRMCEAYTNGNWTSQTVDGNKRWILDRKLFDESTAVSSKPFFKVASTNVEATTSDIAKDSSVLYVEYKVSPSDAVIKVTVPSGDSTGTLSVSNSSSVVSSGNSKVYTVRPDSVSGNTASGTIRFACDGIYNGNVTVSASGTELSKAKNISFDIQTEDFFVPVISEKYATSVPSAKSSYSYADNGQRMIVVGDGETVKGSIVNLDSSSTSRITGVTYEKFTSSSASVDPETSNVTCYAKDSSRDKSGAVQGDLVSCSLSGASFVISHSKDYGYFASSSGVKDEFYSKTFALDSVSVDESSVSYQTVYKTDAEGNKVVDTDATAANRKAAVLEARRRRLNDQKAAYAAEKAGKAMSSCAVPYYYSDGGYVLGSKSHNLTPVGRIIVKYNNDNSQEILVFVKITESPCSSSSYGYAVPASYYLNVNK